MPLAVIPRGTANDFARVAELPLDQPRRLLLAAGGSGCGRSSSGASRAGTRS